MRPKQVKHAADCDWHLDQYDWECSCGAVKWPPKTCWPLPRLALKLGDEERVPGVRQSWNKPGDKVHHELRVLRLWGVMLPAQWRWGWPTVFIGIATLGGVTVCTPDRETSDGL